MKRAIAQQLGRLIFVYIAFFFLFYKCEVLCQVHQLHFSYVLIPLQARMYKNRIEIIEKLLGVLELDSDKHG